MYRWMTHRGVVNKRIRRVWDNRLPMRIKVFMWLTFNNRLQTGVELKKRKWKGSHLCGICGCPETTDHILFTCCVARFVWACFTEALAWDRAPRSLNDFLDTWIPLGCRDYNLKLFLFASVLWGLWTTRNKRAIEGKFPRSPTDVLFKIHAFFAAVEGATAKWRPRQTGEFGGASQKLDRGVPIAAKGPTTWRRLSLARLFFPVLVLALALLLFVLLVVYVKLASPVKLMYPFYKSQGVSLFSKKRMDKLLWMILVIFWIFFFFFFVSWVPSVKTVF